MTTQSLPSRRLFVSMLVSLDGYIAGPNGELDWFRDGDSAFERYCDEMLDSVDVALFGRRSYELMEQYWPRAETDAESPSALAFARRMNTMPKVVLSRTLREARWRNSRVVSDRVGETLTALKEEGGKPIVAWGGAGLVATLAELGLIDEYRLIVHPVLLGSGTRLFGGGERRPLRLVRTSQLGEQLSMLCYEPMVPS